MIEAARRHDFNIRSFVLPIVCVALDFGLSCGILENGEGAKFSALL